MEKMLPEKKKVPGENPFKQDIYFKIQTFAKERGFHLILNSSLEFPSELKNFPIHDITKDFISYYNQINP